MASAFRNLDTANPLPLLLLWLLGHGVIYFKRFNFFFNLNGSQTRIPINANALLASSILPPSSILFFHLLSDLDFRLVLSGCLPFLAFLPPPSLGRPGLFTLKTNCRVSEETCVMADR